MMAITPSPATLLPESASGSNPLTISVVLASDLSLIAEAVAAALASRRFKVRTLTWPRVPDDDPADRQLARLAPDVALLIYDADLSVRMSEATDLLGDWNGPWVVLTGAAPGAVWGGLRAAGAAAVRPSDTGLDEVESLVRHLYAGGRAPCADLLDGYVERWRSVQRRRAEVQLRLNSLSPRERQVLDLLRRGVRVRAIATSLGLSESTVRSQVRAVLRKLGVRSQLAAVALVGSVDNTE